jgi:hypothetical protein
VETVCRCIEEMPGLNPVKGSREWFELQRLLGRIDFAGPCEWANVCVQERIPGPWIDEAIRWRYLVPMPGERHLTACAVTDEARTRLLLDGWKSRVEAMGKTALDEIPLLGEGVLDAAEAQNEIARQRSRERSLQGLAKAFGG